MSVAALSNAGFSQILQSSSNLSGFQQALQTLQSSLSAGNLTAAKNSFAKLQQLNANLSQVTGSTSSASSQLSAALTTLGAALSSGNLSSAQSAFTAVQGDLTGGNSPALAVANGVVNQSVQEIDELLGISNSASSGNSSTNSSTNSSINSLLGSGNADSTPDIASQTTSILSGVYGNHSTTTPSGATAGTNLNVSA